MDRCETIAFGRRAALLAIAGTALLSTSGCTAVYAILARLHGDSFDEGGAPDSDEYEDPHLNRNDRRGESSDSAASGSSDPSDGLPTGGTIPE